MPIYFIVIPIAVLTFLYSFVGWRLLGPLNLVGPFRSLAWGLILVAAAFPISSIAMRIIRIEDSIVDFVSWLAYLSLGFASILFFLLIIKDLAVFSNFLIGKIYLILQLETTETIVESTLGASGESRRQMLWTSVNVAILGTAGVMTSCGVVQARHRIKTENVTIPLKHLSKEFEGFRIVQLSDIHVGPTIKRGFVKEIVERVNALQPDVIVLTGDLVDGSVDYLSKDVEPLMDLKSPHGKYFVTGNHEYYSGVFSWLDKFEKLGLDVLLNEHRVITRNESNLVFGGVTDLKAERSVPDHKMNPAASLAGAPEADAKILLAHQPITVYQASKVGYDLQLSGHTHGGQYFPFSKLVGLAQPFIAGLYRHEKTWLYVNRGIGYWGPPIRLGAPAEITEITLTGTEEKV